MPRANWGTRPQKRDVWITSEDRRVVFRFLDDKGRVQGLALTTDGANELAIALVKCAQYIQDQERKAGN